MATSQNVYARSGFASGNTSGNYRASGRQIFDQPLTEAAMLATGSHVESFRGYNDYNASPARVGQGRIIDSQVVSRKVAKFDPDNGHIDEEIAMDLDNTGHVARATMRSNAGNLRDKDFFE